MNSESICLNLLGRTECPMCIEGKSWLEQEGITYLFRDIFLNPLTKQELLELGRKLPQGLFDLYAPKGARKAGLSEDPKTYSAGQILVLQVENPDMIRYPVFELEDQLIFGFNEEIKLRLLALSGKR